MAVSSDLTSIEDMEGVPTFVGYGGGQGAAVGDDVVIEGTQSLGRRVDNTTAKGFGPTFTNIDLSGAGEHVKIWLFVTQWSEVTKVVARISSGSDDDHELPVGEYPPLGGFIPVWVDVSRTPETGGSANEASIGEIGVLIDIGDVGGNAPNLILDEIMHGTSGLIWSGAGGDMADFRTYEDTNAEGNLVPSNGVDFCYSRLELSDTAVTTFTDSGFLLIFPDQALVADTFMGVSVDLTAASTITLSDATIASANAAGATKRPDFLVTGTTGTLDLDGMTVLGLRLMQLTSGCTIIGSNISALELTQGGADISGSVITSITAAGVPLCDDPTFTALSGVTFVQGSAGHAIEITSTGTYSLDDLLFSGYGADGTTGAAIYNNSGGAVTLNLINGTASATTTIRNGAGASTTKVLSSTLELTGLQNPTEIRIYDAGTTTEIAGQEDVTSGTFSTGIDAATYASVDISIISLGFKNLRLLGISMATDRSIPVSQEVDRQYENV